MADTQWGIYTPVAVIMRGRMERPIPLRDPYLAISLMGKNDPKNGL